MDENDGSAKRRKMFHLAAELGLDRDERIELTQYLLRRDIESWKDLTAAQVDRVLDALEGAHLVWALISLRPGSAH